MTKTTFALAFIALLFGQSTLYAADAVQDLNWKDLVPKAAAAAAEPAKPKTFFSGSAPAAPAEHPNAAPPAPLSEGKFMEIKRRQPGDGKPPAVVADLNGKKIRIGGYVVPLDFQSTNVKEFLLVPFVGACIHVPPPPANQIIYVKVENGFDVKGSFDPVTVMGTLKADTAFTGLADAGYSMEADSVEIRTK